MQSRWPFWAAPCIGSIPSLALASHLLPTLCKYLRQSKLPSCAARYNGVVPSVATSFTELQRYSQEDLLQSNKIKYLKKEESIL